MIYFLKVEKKKIECNVMQIPINLLYIIKMKKKTNEYKKIEL